MTLCLLSVSVHQVWSASEDDDATLFTGTIGGYEYVVAEGWGENPLIGTYSVKIYRSLRDGDYVDGLISERSGQITTVLIQRLDGSAIPALIICFSSGQGQFGDVHIYRVSEEGRLELAYQDESNWFVSVEGYGGRDRFYTVDGALYRSFAVARQDAVEESDSPTGTLRLNFRDGMWESVEP